MSLTKPECIARWQTPDGIKRRELVLEALRSGNSNWTIFLAGFTGVDEIKHGEDLRGFDFRGLNCRLALPFVDARWANFSGLIIKRGHFQQAKLDGANFSDSLIEESMFTQASLQWANFTRAMIKRSFFDCVKACWIILVDSILEDVDFSRSDMTNAVYVGCRTIGKVDFYCAQGLKIESKSSWFAPSDGSWKQRAIAVAAVTALAMIALAVKFYAR